MRITNKMMLDTVLNNLLKNTERLQQLQESIASGKRITKPSDDPVGMSEVLDYRTDLSSIEQYRKNMEQGKSWLAHTESVLNQVNNLLIKAKETAVSQSSANASEETRAAAAKEIESIYNQMIQLANTKWGDRYIFSGYKTSTGAFSSTGTYNGDTGEISIATGQNATLKINLTGQDVFSTTNIFTVLDDLKTALETNDAAGVGNELDNLGSSVTHVAAKMAEVGSRINRMETTENIFTNLKLNIQDVLSKIEDVDIVEAVIDLTSQQNVYQASLLSAAKIANMSLVNFLG